MSERDPDPLDRDLSALFAAERSRPAPLPEARARVLSRVIATVGAPVPAPEAPSGRGHGGAPPAAAPVSGALLKPVLLGLALGGALVAAVAVLDHPAPLPLPSPPAAAVLTPDPGVATASAEDEPAPSAKAAPARPSAEASAPTRRDDSLTAERSILDEANRALGAGQTAATFEALTRHAEAFPRGRLSEEREGLWLRALLAAGRRDEARARAVRFKQLYPRSMLLPALESALGAIP